MAIWHKQFRWRKQITQIDFQINDVLEEEEVDMLERGNGINSFAEARCLNCVVFLKKIFYSIAKIVSIHLLWPSCYLVW